MKPPSPAIDQLCVNTIRVLAIDGVQAANSGHPGLPLGAAPMAHALWSRHLRFNPKNPKWINRDRFILSAGHGSMLQYALLHLAGFDLSIDDLKQFRQFGSRTPGHPENSLTPGVEMATGPLGQGFATAVGMALAERFLGAKYNRPHHHVIDHFTYVIASDGDLMEGIASEAASLAGHQKLGKLVVLYDDNGITIDGTTSIAFTEHVGAKFAAMGWHVQHIDGMDVEAVDRAINEAKRHNEQPSLICAKTTIGFGSPNKAGTSKSHGSPLGPDEVKLTKEALGVPTEPSFWKADEAVEFYNCFTEAGKTLEDNWKAGFEKYRTDYPAEAAELEAALSGKLPTELWSSFPEFSGNVQTRQASAKTIQSFAGLLPNLVGGSADLAESNYTHIESSQLMQANSPTGRNIAYGIREHAMAAATNGINLHGGMRAFAGTFLIFSDYCRPSLRLAALMHTPSIFVFTHDSIGVGEDGPTHQPVEHYMSLRAMPNMQFFRPADANEAAVCWAMAIENTTGPSALSLTRQPLPTVTPAPNADHPARNGGYVLLEGSSSPEVVLIATGSEVSIALAAREVLESEGVSTRVVSLPSWRTFESQSKEYRDSVIARSALCVSIEAGVTLGWERYADISIGLDRFGESAPYQKLMEHFGFTAENVVKTVKENLRSVANV